MNPRKISITEFDYDLPADRIAEQPLARRDDSKLLVYREGQIRQTVFHEISEELTRNSLVVFNDTKVIRARLLFTNSAGGKIEVFCLEPATAVTDYENALARTGTTTWRCLIGGVVKWREEFLKRSVRIGDRTIDILVTKLEKQGDSYAVKFNWSDDGITFGEILAAAGNIPLPPYIKREENESDAGDYQTIFANAEGSVAAPTASLHFTEQTISQIGRRGIETAYLTLHVGAGTFKPVKAETMGGHEMHGEYINVSKSALEKILMGIENVCAVGTTSLRTLESLYWLGQKCLLFPTEEIGVLKQWEVYEEPLASANVSAHDAIDALLKKMEEKNISNLFTRTEILITPGYKIRMAKMLITNFHQPRSTLLLLVAAAIGNDWKHVYEYALQNNFRFLSYGDTGLLHLKK